MFYIKATCPTVIIVIVPSLSCSSTSIIISREAMDPLTEIQFHLKGRTITRDFKQSVRELLSLPNLQQFYYDKYGWSDTIFDTVDWDIFRPVYKKYIAKNGIQWMHKFCSRKLRTGKRVQERDQFHDKRCASCLDPMEDDDHIFTCVKRKVHCRNIINQIKTLRDVVDPYLYVISYKRESWHILRESV